MPTLKPKRTFVYSSDNARRALEAALADRCEVNRTNMSQETRASSSTPSCRMTAGLPRWR